MSLSDDESSWNFEGKQEHVLVAKEFCTALASAVTEASLRDKDLIAKNGDESVFAVLQRMFPQVCKTSI